ncbi:hypothetical protein SANT12839_009610 [Streptomyces antimycoticus]|uniref:Uncharacterized protein n=1 Tax=Streptomyces antimycoticus TaxID=68175 RepID=A0A4D4K171_9ACTN|nr:hypothetical protein SANT12839_009610 [Streptomyces antimycoticus]
MGEKHLPRVDRTAELGGLPGRDPRPELGQAARVAVPQRQAALAQQADGGVGELLVAVGLRRRAAGRQSDHIVAVGQPEHGADGGVRELVRTARQSRKPAGRVREGHRGSSPPSLAALQIRRGVR